MRSKMRSRMRSKMRSRMRSKMLLRTPDSAAQFIEELNEE